METLKLFLRLNFAEKIILAAIFLPLFIVTIARLLTEIKTIF